MVGRKMKVKTGCRTCKARHVKCDEGRPSCDRCVSTGRTCEGYGIWGGGSVSNGQNEHSRQAITLRATANPVKHAVSSQYGKLSTDQETCFRWFRYRTYTKLPLPFITPFWRTLVLQACVTEPAILHAVLALGSAHQRESLNDGVPGMKSYVSLDAQQEFMLREYGLAIRSLQPHFSSRDRRSMQVALVACIIFTFFENLLGRYAIANAHLHSGLRLLAECYTHADDIVSETNHTAMKRRGHVDDWIIETFTRLHVQAALLGQGLPELNSKLPVFPVSPIPTIFESANQAANYMDRLMLDILHFADNCDLAKSNSTYSILVTKLCNNREHLLEELRLWIMAYNATNPSTDEGFSPVDGFYMKVLRGYHTMLTISMNTCNQPLRETAYDLCTGDFVFLIEQLVEVWRAHVARPVWHLTPWTTEMPRRISHSVGDKGWIPLLYFIAVKCRVRRIRLQAIQLLSQTAHKEGIWDSRLVLIVAKEITRIEEGDYYAGSEVDSRFTLVSIPTEKDIIALSPLPDHRRLYNIHVGLPDHPTGNLTLEYEQRRSDGSCVERRKRCYDLQISRWYDIMIESSAKS